MAIIVEAPVSTVKAYRGKSVSTKYGNKKHKVYFRTSCDDFTLQEALVLAKTSDNVISLNYKGLESNTEYLGLGNTGVLVTREYSFGNNITEDDIQNVLNQTPSGVTPIILLPDDFKDLHLIWEFCNKFPKVRFCGGKLFNIDGVRLGYCNSTVLEGKGIKPTQSNMDNSMCSCGIEVVDFNIIELQVSDKPEKHSKPRETSKPKPKIASFASLLSSNPVDL